MIYLRTDDREVFLVFESGEGRDKDSKAEESVGAAGGEEELCVMSVFPWLSYFEMCLNSPPSVRPVPGLRAGRSPPKESELTGAAGGQHSQISGSDFPPLNPLTLKLSD